MGPSSNKGLAGAGLAGCILLFAVLPSQSGGAVPAQREPAVLAGRGALIATTALMTALSLAALGLLAREVGRRRRAERDMRRLSAGLEEKVSGEKGLRQAAEEQTRRSEAWLASLVRVTQDAVVSIDRGARIVLFNPSAERIFGWSAAEVQGRKVDLLMGQPYASEHDGYIEAYERTGHAHAIGHIRTVIARRKSGEEFPIELSVTEIPGAEEVRYAAFIRDISEKSRLQQELVHRERLAAVGTTMASLAHEIGNPLNAMFLNVQLLERRLARAGTEKADAGVGEAVGTLRREIERLTQLLSEFRLLSRPQSLELRPVSLERLVEGLLSAEQALHERRGIRVERNFPPATPRVVADADRLKQAVLNLLKNAAEAMPQGGVLSLSLAEKGAEVELAVADTGVGLPDGLDVFQPFATTKPEGTGLGLAIVQQIVARHGGTVGCESEKGRGATFRLTLPVEGPSAD
jgi:two-component system sensor kinase FixL